MKKFILSALVVVVAGFGVVSCNNGQYDANPEVDNSKVPNPLDPKNHPGNGLNTMAANIDGVWTGFPFGYFGDTLGPMMIVGYRVVGTYYEQLSFAIDSFKGAGTYRFNDSTDQIYARYHRGNTNDFLNYETWEANGFGDKGEIELTIANEADNRWRGTFRAILYKEKDFIIDTTQKVVITDGKFHAEKK